MEVRDGFIVGVFNYCDRWCERCPLTGRCRVFADIAEFEFERDHGPLTEPMQIRQERKFAGTADRWRRKFGVDIDAIQEEVEKRVAAGEDLGPPDVRLEDLELETRAKEVAFSLGTWLRDAGDLVSPEAREAAEVISHFLVFIPSKVYRALMGVGEDDAGDARSDCNGSAKAALLAVDRVRAALVQLADSKEINSATLRSLLGEMAFIAQEMEKRFPIAQSFVRPGFDEPDEVRKLEAAENP